MNANMTFHEITEVRESAIKSAKTDDGREFCWRDYSFKSANGSTITVSAVFADKKD